MEKQRFPVAPLASRCLSSITRYYKDETKPLLFTRKVFTACLSLCYLSAFASLHSQYPGLYSKGGLLPVATFVTNLDRSLAASAGSLPAQLSAFPSLVWLHQALGIDVDAWCELLCVWGALLACCAFVQAIITQGGGHAGILASLWCLYFSLYLVGQTFLSFQWDVLLLEAGFLSVFLLPWLRARAGTGPPIQVVWLLRFLTFKLMLLSGVVKLQSLCPTWLHLTALHYHFATQCIPTPLAWYAHHMPSLLLQTGVAFTFVAEGPATWLLIAPHRVARHVGATVQIALQLMIILTGNYTFFNWLTITLAIIHLDDDALTSACAPLTSLRRRAASACARWLPASVLHFDRPQAPTVGEESRQPLLPAVRAEGGEVPPPQRPGTANLAGGGKGLPLADHGKNAAVAASGGTETATTARTDTSPRPTGQKGPSTTAGDAPAASTVSTGSAGQERPTQATGAAAKAEVNASGGASCGGGGVGSKYSNLAARAAWVASLGLLLLSFLVMFRLERHRQGADGQGGKIRGIKEGDWQISLAFTVAQMDAWVAWLVRWTLDYLAVIFVVLPIAVTAREISAKQGSLSALSTSLKIAVQITATILGLIMLSVAARPFVSICPPSAVESSLLPPVPEYLHTKASSFHVSSAYGLFRRMTGVGPHGSVARPEIIVEGSLDMITWAPYEFRYKPGDVMRAPPLVEPHQPRLDWQMWFAALGRYQNNPWLLMLVGRILQGAPAAVSLLDTSRLPFPLDAPPKMLRIQLYEYDFTEPHSNASAGGAWWKRTYKGEYLPPVSLDNASLVSFMARFGNQGKVAPKDFRELLSASSPTLERLAARLVWPVGFWVALAGGALLALLLTLGEYCVTMVVLETLLLESRGSGGRWMAHPKRE